MNLARLTSAALGRIFWPHRRQPGAAPVVTGAKLPVAKPAARPPLPPTVALPATARIVAEGSVVLITTGLLNQYLGITLTTGFIRSLGFEPVAQPRAGTWWRESDVKPIAGALVKFLLARNF